MPVYNAAPYVESAVKSITAQTVSDFEFVIVDDGSTDESWAILERLAAVDHRLKLISRPNRGIVAALNDGLAVAQGTFVARMDADDLAYPDRFARQLAYLAANPRCVAVGGAVLQIDRDSAPIGVSRWPTDAAAIEADLLVGRGGIPHPTAMIRAAALNRVGGYRPEHEWVEDKDLWLRLAEVGTLANLAQVVLAYRLSETSVCGLRGTEQARRLQRLLAETYRRRGIDEPVPEFATAAARGRIAGAVRRKWIRTAARQGYYETAGRHARRLLREAPLSPATWTTLATAAIARLHRRHPPVELPAAARTLRRRDAA